MSQWATLSEPRSSAPPRGNDDESSEDEMDQLRPSATRSFRASPPMDRTRPPSSVPAKRRNDGNDREGRFGAPKRPRQSEPGRPVPQGPARPPGAGRQPAPPPGNRQGPIVRRVMVEKGSLPDFRPAAQRERDRDRERPTGGGGSGGGSGAARVAGGSNRPAPPAPNRPGPPGPSRPGPPGSNRPGIAGPNRPGPPGSNRPPLPTGPRHSTGSSASRPTQPRHNAPTGSGPSAQSRPSTSANSARQGRPNISASQPARRRPSPDSSPSPPPPATQPAILNGVRPFPLASQVAKRREDRRNSFKYDESGAIEISSSDDEGPPVLNRRHTMPAVVLLPGTHMEGDALVIEDSDEEPAQPPPKPAAPAAKATQKTTAAAQKAPAKPPAGAKPAGECIDLTFSDEEDELLLRPTPDDPPPPRSPSPPMLPQATSPSPPPLPSPRSPSPPPVLPAHSPSPPQVPPAHSPSPPPLPSPSPPPPPALDESRPATPIRIGPPRGKRPGAPSTPLSARKDPDLIEFPSSPAVPQGTPATHAIRIGPPIGKRPTVQSPESGASASSAFASSVRPSETATLPVASTQPTPDAGASTSSAGIPTGLVPAATAGGVDPPRSSPKQAAPPALAVAQDAPVVPGIATLIDEDMVIEEEPASPPPIAAPALPSDANLPKTPSYYMKYFTAPVKAVDSDGTLRWTFLCKLCDSYRSLPREEHEQAFDPRVNRALFGNVSTHVRDCHLDVDPAQLQDVTVQERMAQWTVRRRFTLTSDGELVFGPSHLPKDDTTGAGVASSGLPSTASVPVVPPAAQLETPVAPESPQVRRLVNESSSVADPARSPESAPGPDERNKRLLALWGPPQKDVWRDVPRWQFVCNACPAKRTIVRNPSHKTFEEGRWGWSALSPLRTHVADKHPDAWALFEQQTASAAVESQVRPKSTSRMEEVDPELMDIDDEDRWNVESPLVAKARLPQATVSRSLTPTPPPQTPPHVTGELQDEGVALSSEPAENLPQASTSIAQTAGRRGPGVDTPLRTQGRPPVSSRPVNPFASPTVFYPSQPSAKAKRVGAIEQYMSPLRKDRDLPVMSPSPMASASAQAATSVQTPRPAVAPHPLAEMQIASSSGALTDDDADVFGPTRTNSSPSIVALSRQPSAPANAEAEAATPCPEVDMDQVTVEPDAPPPRASSSYRTESPASSLEVRQMLEDDGIARPVPVPAPAATAEGDRKFIRVFADAFIGVWRRRLHESAAPASNLDIDPALDIPPTPPPPAESPPPLPMPAVDPAVAAALTVVGDPSPGLLAPALEAVVLQSDPERQPSQDADDQRRRTRSMSRHSTDAETMSNDGLPLMQVMRLKRARHARRGDAAPAPGAGVQQASPPDSNGDLEPLTDLSDCGPSAVASTRSNELALVKTARDLRWPAEEVDTLIYDVINDLPEYDQYDKSLRTVFEHVMLANTLHDEPDAPPITVDNKINDDPCPPWEFYYTNKLVYGQNVKRGDPTKLKGCNCVGGCRPDSKTCACLRRQQRHFQLTDENNTVGFNYDQNGRVVDPRFPIFECNDACGCDETCMNRVVQHGRQIPVEIANTRKKGWGVFAKSSIPANTFVGIYAGELITDRESHARGAIYELFGRTYMFTIDNWYLTNEFRRKYRKLHRPHTLAPDDRGEERADDGKQTATFVVDAFHVGNFTRFLNHCCDPNCVIVSVHINEPHIYKPYLCLFTCKDVKAGEELTFSYRGVIDEEEFKEAKKQNKGKRRKRGVGLKGQCQCGAPRCIGTLF